MLILSNYWRDSFYKNCAGWMASQRINQQIAIEPRYQDWNGEGFSRSILRQQDRIKFAERICEPISGILRGSNGSLYKTSFPYIARVTPDFAVDDAIVVFNPYTHFTFQKRVLMDQGFLNVRIKFLQWCSSHLSKGRKYTIASGLAMLISAIIAIWERQKLFTIVFLCTSIVSLAVFAMVKARSRQVENLAAQWWNTVIHAGGWAAQVRSMGYACRGILSVNSELRKYFLPKEIEALVDPRIREEEKLKRKKTSQQLYEIFSARITRQRIEEEQQRKERAEM